MRRWDKGRHIGARRQGGLRLEGARTLGVHAAPFNPWIFSTRFDPRLSSPPLINNKALREKCVSQPFERRHRGMMPRPVQKILLVIPGGGRKLPLALNVYFMNSLPSRAVIPKRAEECQLQLSAARFNVSSLAGIMINFLVRGMMNNNQSTGCGRTLQRYFC